MTCNNAHLFEIFQTDGGKQCRVGLFTKELPRGKDFLAIGGGGSREQSLGALAQFRVLVTCEPLAARGVKVARFDFPALEGAQQRGAPVFMTQELVQNFAAQPRRGVVIRRTRDLLRQR